MSAGAAGVDRPSRPRALARVLIFLVANLIIVPLYAAAIGPLKRWRRPLQVLWCRVMAAAAGVRVRTIGTPVRRRPVLFVANHVSYLDIPVVSANVEGCFVAKAEIAGWPLFGIVAKVTRTVFVRRVGAEVRAQRDELLQRLLDGENLILFAEGTSTDGSGVAPFKSSLFSVVERLPSGFPLTVQPLAITYARDLAGRPLTGPRRQLYCWFGEATMAPHLWRMLGLKGCEVELRFLEPLSVAPGMSRKQLAAECEARVARAIAMANGALAGGGPSPTNEAVPAAVVAARRSEPAGR